MGLVLQTSGTCWLSQVNFEHSASVPSSAYEQDERMLVDLEDERRKNRNYKPHEDRYFVKGYEY